MTRRREIRKLCENFAACEKSDILDEIIRPLRPQWDFTLSEEDTALGEDPARLPCEMTTYHKRYREPETQTMLQVTRVILNIILKIG